MNEPQCRPLGPALLIGLCTTALALVALGLQTLSSDAYWWHVAIGEAIWSWQLIPDEQLFLFTLPTDEPWVYTSWLGQLLIFGLHQAAGAELSLLMRNVIAALSVGLIAYYSSRRADPLIAIFAPALVALACFLFFASVEPAMFTVVPVTLLVAAGFLLFERPERFWPAFFLPGVVLVVINFDFASAVASIFIALVVAGELLRRSGSAEHPKRVVISAAISALSVPALFGFAYAPPYWSQSVASTFALPSQWYAASVIIPVILTVAVVALLFQIDNERLPASRHSLAVLVCGTALLALVAPSTLLVFAITTAFVLCAPVAALVDQHSLHRPSATTLAIALIVLGAIAITVQPGTPTRAPILTTLHSDVRTEPPLAGTMHADLPLRCAEELRRTGTTLRVFHAPEHAGFIMHHIFRADQPQPLLFDDHRDLTDPELQAIAELLRTEPIARGHFQQLGITAAVVDRERYATLVEELNEAPEWHDLRPDRDEPNACFLRVDGP